MRTVGNTWFYAVCALAMAAFMVIGCKGQEEDENPENDSPTMADYINSIAPALLELDQLLSETGDGLTEKQAETICIEWLSNNPDIASWHLSEDGTLIEFELKNGFSSEIRLDGLPLDSEDNPVEDTEFETDSTFIADFSFKESDGSKIDCPEDDGNVVLPTKTIYIGYNNTDDYIHPRILVWQPFAYLQTGMNDCAEIRRFVNKNKRKLYYTPDIAEVKWSNRSTIYELASILKTARLENKPFAYLALATHGEYDEKKRKSYIYESFPVEKFSELANYDYYKELPHKKYMDDNILGYAFGGIGAYTKISSKLVGQYLKGTTGNLIVFNASCYSAKGTDMRDAFLNTAGCTYIGSEVSVTQNQIMPHIKEFLFYSLKRNSVFDTKMLMTARHGIFDCKYFKIYFKNNDDYILKGPVASRITYSTKADDQTGIGCCHIDDFRLEDDGIKRYCGLVFSDKTDNPTADNEDSRMVWFELDHDITEGEDYFFSMDRLKPDTQYWWRAFLCAAYDEGTQFIYADEIETFTTGEPEDPGDYIDIPDPEFKRYLTSKKNQRFNADDESCTFTDEYIDADRDGEISVSEAERIEYINVSLGEYDVHSLKGIERMPNLIYLACRGDDSDPYAESFRPREPIDGIDLSGNTSLKFLKLNNSGIKHLDASFCKDLKKIECFGNSRLETIELQGLTNLESLECHLCANLSSIGIEGLQNLSFLKCDHCPCLTSLDVAALSNLSTLYCSCCPSLTTLNVAGLQSLCDLLCDNCNITSLDLSGCGKLGMPGQIFSCSNNPISYLNVSGTALHYMDFFDTSAGTLSVEGGPTLQRIGIASSSITHLSFSNCPELESIGCSSKSLTEVNVSGAAEGVGLGIGESTSRLKITGGRVLKNFSIDGLEFLDLSECQALEKLSISHDIFSSSQPLKDLDISGCNNLLSLRAENTLLKSLDLNHCKSLQRLELKGCTALETLYLPHPLPDNYSEVFSWLHYTPWGEWHYSHTTEGGTEYGTYFPMIYVDGVLYTYIRFQ